MVLAFGWGSEGWESSLDTAGNVKPRVATKIHKILFLGKIQSVCHN